MMKSLDIQRWLPAALQQDHPLTRYHLRKPPPAYVKQVLFGSSLGLFVLFGGLSLPMLYFVCSLVVLLQLATGTAQKIHQSRLDGAADLISLTMMSRREILLSTWAAGIWQLRKTWLMPIYRVVHGLLLIGVLVFAVMFSEIPTEQSLLVIFGVTLLIALQPYAEMYFSGMIGLLCAALIRDRFLSLATTTFITILYWLMWVGGAVLVAVTGLRNLPTFEIVLIFALPLIVPAILGGAAQRLAERSQS